MTARMALAGCILAAALAGCQPAAGTVVEKQHEDPRTTFFLMPAGKVLVPVTQIRPERWVLVLDTGAHVTVTREQWQSVDVGDWWGES